MLLKNWLQNCNLCHLVVSGKVEGFPDVALVRLSVSHQAEGPVAGLVQDLAAVGHAGSDAQALAQGPRGAVDKVQPETKNYSLPKTLLV